MYFKMASPGQGVALRRFIKAHGVSDVVVLDRYVARWGQTLRGAGLGPPTPVGGVAIYRV